ncbi:MAG: hypothetical protein HEQ35_29790 [Gloeotrichia echinulata IR180]|jgi:hypothetical protein|nr:hypothetical protein [Gloeotrichia echinulata DEX184]
MFFGQIERECLDNEFWSLSYKTKLPERLQLLVDQEQGICDIWEYQQQPNDLLRSRNRANKAIVKPD